MTTLPSQLDLFPMPPALQVYPWVEELLGVWPGKYHGDTSARRRPRPIEVVEYRSGLIVLYGRHRDGQSWYHETYRLDGQWIGRSDGRAAEGNNADVRLLFRERRKVG